MIKTSDKSFQIFLLLGIFVTATFVTPWHNFEASVVPKLASLTIFAGLGCLFLLKSKNLKVISSKLFFFSNILGILLAMVNLLINNQFFSERVFGVQGRNAGALTFISLMLLTICAYCVSEHVDYRKIVLSIKLSAFVISLYFVVQIQGYDSASWQDVYGKPSSTLGNPNFVSAYLAIGLVVTLPLLTSRSTSWVAKAMALFTSIIELYVIIEIQAFQGFLIIIAAVLFMAVNQAVRVVHRLRINLYFIVSFCVLLTGTVSLFILSFSAYLGLELYTVKARIEYWTTGIRMAVDSPIFGQGFDFYGENYLRFRTQSSDPLTLGLGGNSAHNYFIDIAAFAGFPLLICVLLPIWMVLSQQIADLIKSAKTLHNDHGFSPFKLGVFLAWLGFLLQALVSPINIALAYLGFILTGFLYQHSKEKQYKPKVIPMSSKNTGKFMISNSDGYIFKLISWLLFLPLAIAIPILGIQPFVSDAKFRKALEQGNGYSIYKISMNQPKNFQRMEYASKIFLENKLQNLALPIIRVMVEENPENIRGWKLLEGASDLEAEKLLARLRIRALDPWNPEFKDD